MVAIRDPKVTSIRSRDKELAAIELVKVLPSVGRAETIRVLSVVLFEQNSPVLED